MAHHFAEFSQFFATTPNISEWAESWPSELLWHQQTRGGIGFRKSFLLGRLEGGRGRPLSKSLWSRGCSWPSIIRTQTTYRGRRHCFGLARHPGNSSAGQELLPSGPQNLKNWRQTVMMPNISEWAEIFAFEAYMAQANTWRNRFSEFLFIWQMEGHQLSTAMACRAPKFTDGLL